MDLDPLVAYADDPVTDEVHHPYAAFNQGWDAHEASWPIKMNPYDDGTTEARWWTMGWTEADDQDDDGDECSLIPVGAAKEENHG